MMKLLGITPLWHSYIMADSDAGLSVVILSANYSIYAGAHITQQIEELLTKNSRIGLFLRVLLSSIHSDHI